MSTQIVSKKDWPALIEGRMPDVSAALPQGTIEAAQLKVAFMSAFNKKPDLAQCTQMSVCSCLVNAAMLGIIPETPEQHAYLIPRNQKIGDDWGKVCELVISYRGFCHMILRGKEVATIDSGIVHQGDAFEFQKGDPVICKFSPNLSDLQRHQKPVIAAYCLLIFKNGARKLELMDNDELKKVEQAMLNQNKDKITPAWKMWRDEMMRKAPIKRIAKTSDLGPIVARAAEIDNQHVLRAIPVQEKALVMPSGRTIEAGEPEALPESTEPDPNENLEALPELPF